jgi:hypothetical protein
MPIAVTSDVTKEKSTAHEGRIVTSQFTGMAGRLVLAVVASFAFVACGGDGPGSSDQSLQRSTVATPESTSSVEQSDGGNTNMRIRFRIGDAEATATLRDNESARDFASLLPLTVDMRDLFGSEKPGPLPRALAEGGEHQFTYQVGDVAYWPPAHDIALFYADDGQRTIPSPGIVVLGTIDSGLNEIAAAGDDFQMTIEPLD